MKSPSIPEGQPEMVFDRRCSAEASTRYPRMICAPEPDTKTTGFARRSQDHCILLTLSFLMVLDGAPARRDGTCQRQWDTLRD